MKFLESTIKDLYRWQQIVSLQTLNGHYRVEITWSLDRWQIRVWRRVQELI
jgi:hypothetical protein